MKVKTDDDIINVSLALAKFTIGYFKDDEDFHSEVVRIVGEDKWYKFLEFMASLVKAAREKEKQNRKIIDMNNWKRTKK